MHCQESPISQEVLLECCSKTRARKKFVASINNPMLGSTNQRSPELFIGYFSKLYFQFLWTVYLLKRHLKSSHLKFFVKPSLPKSMFLGCRFFEMNCSKATWLGRWKKKHCGFSDSYTLFFSQCTLQIIDICDSLYAWINIWLICIKWVLTIFQLACGRKFSGEQ